MYNMMLDVLKLKGKGQYDSAFSIINDFLSHKIKPEERCEVIAFRASLQEDLGKFEEANEDYMEALSLIADFNYTRYTLELSIGSVCEKLGRREEAELWHKRALETSIKGKGFSGASAVRNFMMLKGDDALTGQERILCNQVVMESWELFRLPGKPDLSNLNATASFLINEAGKKR